VFKKGKGVTSVLTELLSEELRLVAPIRCLFLRVIKRTSDVLDLLPKIIHECPYLI